MGFGERKNRTVSLAVPELVSEREQAILTGKMLVICELFASIKTELATYSIDNEFKQLLEKSTRLNNTILRAISHEAIIDDV